MFTWIIIITTILSIIYVIKVRRDFDSKINTPENFTKQEKIIIWILSFINPMLFGAIFYYSLKSRLPKKAKYANNVSWIAFIIYIVYFFFITFSKIKGL